MRGVRSLILILILIAAAVVIFAYIRGDHSGGVSGDVKSLWKDTQRSGKDLGERMDGESKDLRGHADHAGEKMKEVGRDTGDRLNDATK